MDRTLGVHGLPLFIDSVAHTLDNLGAQVVDGLGHPVRLIENDVLSWQCKQGRYICSAPAKDGLIVIACDVGNVGLVNEPLGNLPLQGRQVLGLVDDHCIKGWVGIVKGVGEHLQHVGKVVEVVLEQELAIGIMQEPELKPSHLKLRCVVGHLEIDHLLPRQVHDGKGWVIHRDFPALIALGELQLDADLLGELPDVAVFEHLLATDAQTDKRQTMDSTKVSEALCV